MYITVQRTFNTQSFFKVRIAIILLKAVETFIYSDDIRIKRNGFENN